MSKGFGSWDTNKHKVISRRGGLLNEKRYEFDSNKAREAALKRWNKVREKELTRSEDVVQL